MTKKRIINKTYIIITVIIALFLIIGAYLFLFVFDKDKLTINDYKTNSENYISYLEYRLNEVGYSDNLEKDNLISKLAVIDGLYSEGMINANEELYYFPSDNCSKKPCFSIRETYLFNFNFK